MGLDTVELVMAIEEEFDVEIPNSDESKLAVLGDMHDYVVRALHQRNEISDETQVWKRLSRVVIGQLGVNPGQVTRSAHLVYDLRAD